MSGSGSGPAQLAATTMTASTANALAATAVSRRRAKCAGRFIPRRGTGKATETANRAGESDEHDTCWVAPFAYRSISLIVSWPSPEPGSMLALDTQGIVTMMSLTRLGYL
ncbi:hypothetical protein K474DRAFT_1674046 [Panus rudis PR-1116 ss-1]|nr:hypothetical protein K474DRAFT_1674046 [Panus rudis PR-1116 ss-1]